MKNKLFTLVASLVLAFTNTTPTVAGEGATKKIAPPTAVSSGTEITMYGEEEVIGYWVPLNPKNKDYGSAQFKAKPDGKLLGIRLVIRDHTDYDWDCQYNSGGHLVMDGNENGVHSDNTVTIDRMAWMKFFREKVSLKPFVYYPPLNTLTKIEEGREGVWYTDAGVISKANQRMVAVKPVKSDFIETFPFDELLVNLPKDQEKFLLGKKNGKYVPLRISAKGEYYIPAGNDMPNSQAIKALGMAKDGKTQ